MSSNNAEFKVYSKADLIKSLNDDQTIRPVVVYDLIYHKILTWDEFENIFLLAWKGEHKQELLDSYRAFWNEVTDKLNGSGQLKQESSDDESDDEEDSSEEDNT